MTSISLTDRFLELDTVAGADVLLIEGFTGTERVSRPFAYELDLLALREQASSVEPGDLIGTAMTVAMRLSDGSHRYINGIVRRFTTGAADHMFVSYTAELVPWFALLELSSNARVFTDKRAPDVIESVFKDAGFRDYRLALSRQYTAWDFLVQHRESDFTFVSRLLEEEGIFYHFEHEDGKHTLVLADDKSYYKPCPGQSSFEYGHQEHVAEDNIATFLRQQALRTGSWTFRDQHFERTKSDLLVTAKSVAAKGIAASLERYDYPGGYARKFNKPEERLPNVKPEGDRAVRDRIEAEEMGVDTASGSSSCRALASGYKMTVQSVGQQSVSGEFLLTSVTHNASQRPSYMAEKQGDEMDYSNTFTAIPAQVVFRPPRETPRPTVQGFQTAIVAGESGNEIWPDKFGRVRLQFPWDRNETNACWARVAQPWASSGFGHQWFPRMGDQVVVDFENGDPNHPVVIGSLYNGQNMPPFKLPDNKTQSGIMTRSSPEGGSDNCNILRFEDKKGSEEVHVQAEKNFTLVIKNDETREIRNTRTTTIQGNDTTTIKKGNESLTIEEGDQSVLLKEGDQKFKLNLGDHFTELQKGDHTTVLHEGDHDTQLKQGNQTITLSMGDQTVKLSTGNLTTKLDLGSVSTEAMQGIELKVGQSSVKIDQMGVTIKGMMITIEGQMETKVKGLITQIEGEVQTTLKGVMTQVSGSAMLQASGGITMIG